MEVCRSLGVVWQCLSVVGVWRCMDICRSMCWYVEVCGGVWRQFDLGLDHGFAHVLSMFP